MVDLIGKHNVGYRVTHQRSKRDPLFSIVLAVDSRDDKTACYVTWLHNGETGGFGGGHYFQASQAEEAFKDYETR
jgi:hypothetical protein